MNDQRRRSTDLNGLTPFGMVFFIFIGGVAAIAALNSSLWWLVITAICGGIVVWSILARKGKGLNSINPPRGRRQGPTLPPDTRR